jgi:hypothetical protein
MRYMVGLVLVLALGLMGCSETTGTAGSGGEGGGGGSAGTVPVECPGDAPFGCIELSGGVGPVTLVPDQFHVSVKFPIIGPVWSGDSPVDDSQYDIVIVTDNTGAAAQQPIVLMFVRSDEGAWSCVSSDDPDPDEPGPNVPCVGTALVDDESQSVTVENITLEAHILGGPPIEGLGDLTLSGTLYWDGEHDGPFPFDD